MHSSGTFTLAVASERRRRQPLAAIVAGAWLFCEALSVCAQAPSLRASDAGALETAEATARSGPRLLPGEPIPLPELEAFVDATVRVGMDEANVAGAAVSIVQGGRIVLSKGYGFASFDPVRRVNADSTLFRLGSITKTFTWISVMRAVEAGKIDLDAPVNGYLPVELQIPDEGFGQPVRMRDLMTHSPGFEDRTAGILFIFDPERIVPLERFLRDYRPRRIREPGVLTSYSNYGTALAGAVVASVEGVGWHELIERDILTPLQLAHTSGREPYPPRAGLPAPMAEPLAQDVSGAFRWNGVAHVARDFEFVTQAAPAGSMSASAGDIARYMLLLLGEGTLDGVTVFGPAAARAFRTPLTSLPPGVGALDGGFFETLEPGGFRGYGHAGATLSFFSALLIVPELDLGIFVATNTEGGGRISNALPSRVIERFYGPARSAPALATPELARSARVYAGEYLSTRRRNGGLEGFLMRLVSTMSVSVTSDGYLVVAGGLGPTQRFVPAGEPGVFRPAAGPEGAGGMLRFELDGDGDRAVRVVTMPVAFERVGWLHSQQTLALAAGLTVFASLAIVVGALLRWRRARVESRGQVVAARILGAAAVLWLASVAIFAVWLASVFADIVVVFRDWPGTLALASSVALAASAATLLALALLPAVWRSASDSGWTIWRRGRHTLALAIFATFGALLAAWGALAPWSA